MFIYTAVILTVLVLSFLAEMTARRRPFNACGIEIPIDGATKPNIILTVIIILILSSVSGLRFFVGTDYLSYLILYEDVRTKGMEYLSGQGVEFGYLLLNAICGFFQESPFLMFFISALITNSLVILTLRKHSHMFWLSCMLYILTFLYFITFNLVRQSIAMSIIFYGHQFLKEKKLPQYLAVIACATLFHTSAIGMVAIYFIVNRPAWSKPVWICLGASLVLFVFYNTFIYYLAIFLEGSGRYADYIQWFDDANHGANILRLLASVVPVVFSFLFRKRLAALFPESNTVVNMSAFCVMFYILSIRELYFARLTLYFSVYYLLLLPDLVKSFQKVTTKIFVVITILVCYTAYCYMLLPADSNVLPYNSIWSAPKNWNATDYFTR